MNYLCFQCGEWLALDDGSGSAFHVVHNPHDCSYRFFHDDCYQIYREQQRQEVNAALDEDDIG